MDSSMNRVERLAKRLTKIADPSMRLAYTRHVLQKMEISQIADLITIAVSRAELHETPYSILMLTVSLSLADPECDRLRTAVISLLEARNQSDLGMMLRKEANNSLDENCQRVPDFGFGRPLTLGERKSLARRNDHNLINRVLQDPHPSVIRILLSNPGLTESQVVRLCARRPTEPDIQREVFLHQRWIVRHAVKMAIVLNPYTPLDIALQIIPHLKKQDRRKVAAAQDLPSELRENCQRDPKGSTIH